MISLSRSRFFSFFYYLLSCFFQPVSLRYLLTHTNFVCVYVRVCSQTDIHNVRTYVVEGKGEDRAKKRIVGWFPSTSSEQHSSFARITSTASTAKLNATRSRLRCFWPLSKAQSVGTRVAPRACLVFYASARIECTCMC